MRKLNHSWAVMICALTIVACQPKVAEKVAPDLEALKAELQEMENTFAEGENTKNVDLILQYYADDAVSLPPNVPKLVGKEAIKARQLEQFDKMDSGTTVAFEVVDVFADGDLVVEVGKSIITTADGEEMTGKYISVFERRDGKLLCIRDSFSPDQEMDEDDDEEENDEEMEDEE